MEIITKINWVDVLIVIIMLRISYIAFQDGLSHEIFPLFGTVATAVITLHYYHKIALYISRNLSSLPIGLTDFLAFVLLLTGIGFIFKLLRAFLDAIIKVTWHPLLERFGGLVVGALRAALVASIVLMILALMPLSYLQWSIRDRSLTGMHFLRIAPHIYGRVAPLLPTVTIGGSAAGGESMVRDLVADKSIAPKKENKESPTTAE